MAIITGTPGDDNLNGTSRTDKITGGNGNDTINGNGGVDTLEGGQGNDHLVLHRRQSDIDKSSASSALHGNEGNDTLEASVVVQGQVHMFGGDGDDTFILDLTNQTGHQGHHAYGGEGANTYNFTNIHLAQTTVVGRIDDFNASSDTIQIEGQTIDLFGLPSQIQLADGTFVTVKVVSYENPALAGDPLGAQQFLCIGDNAFYALEGARLMADGSEEQHFVPPPINLLALPSVQYVDQQDYVPVDAYEGISFDSYLTLGRTAVVQGGSGNDFIYFDKRGSGQGNEVYGNDGDDVINGGQGHDTVDGGSGNDFLSGGIDNDLVFAGEGNDQVWGGSGSDTLFGESGNDILNGGSAGSSEYTLGVNEISGQVYRLYQGVLDRNPDQGGFDNWISHLENGHLSLLQAISGFVNSPEFQIRYGNTSNEQFVTLLYNNVLDREPDAGGFQNWTHALNSGALTREEVVRGFTESPEFKNKTTDDYFAYVAGLRPVDDVLHGGSGADTFVFSGNFGRDVIEDFDPTQQGERIDLSEVVGIDNYSDLLANHLVQNGSDTIVFDHYGNSIVLTDVSSSSLSSNDFLF